MRSLLLMTLLLALAGLPLGGCVVVPASAAPVVIASEPVEPASAVPVVTAPVSAPVPVEELARPLLYIRIISIEDKDTGEPLAGDVSINGVLLANSVRHFEGVVSTTITNTVKVEAPGYEPLDIDVYWPGADRDKQIVIPWKLRRKE